MSAVRPVLSALIVLALAACGGTPKSSGSGSGTGTGSTGGTGGTGQQASVTISGTDPTTLVVGTSATVLGKGFGNPATDSITLDTVTITNFLSGSNDGKILFTVPALDGLPAEGKSVTLKVTNPTGSATTQVTVKPAPAPVQENELFVQYVGSPAIRPPGAGETRSLSFGVQAITSAVDNYNVTAFISSGWSASVTDLHGNPLTSLSIPASPAPDGTAMAFNVSYTVPTDATDSTTGELIVVVTSQSNPSFTGVSSAVTLMPGVWPDTQVVPMAVVKLTDGAFVDGHLQAAAGSTLDLTIDAQLPEAGTYTPDIQVTGDTDHKWTIGGDTAAFTAATDGTKKLHLTVTGAAGAPDADLHFTLNGNPDDGITGELVVPLHLAQ